jgi:uncharacterized protein YjiS (DUF1127 family)
LLVRIGTLTRSGFRLATWWLGRLAAAHHEMQMLLRADERALKDIGLTPGDAYAVAQCDVMAQAAAARRNEAMAVARHRRAANAAALCAAAQAGAHPPSS